MKTYIVYYADCGTYGDHYEEVIFATTDEEYAINYVKRFNEIIAKAKACIKKYRLNEITYSDLIAGKCANESNYFVEFSTTGKIWRSFSKCFYVEAENRP